MTARAEAQYSAPAPDEPDACLLACMPLPEVTIGDVSGDGIADWAQGVLAPTGQRGSVRLLDGATGAMIREIVSPVHLASFGMGVFGVQAGVGLVAELAVVAVDGNGHTVLAIFSITSGQPTATITVSEAGAAAAFSIVAMGDVGQDGIVSVDDLGMALEFCLAHATGAAVAQADFDGDGTVSESDVWDLSLRLGTSAHDAGQGDVVSWLPGFIGGTLPPDDEGGEAGYGFLGCLWCAIKCGGALSKGTDCIGVRCQVADQCFALHPDLNSLEYTECLEAREKPAFVKCLKDVVDAVGDCGPCVTKCVPTPTWAQ